MSRFPRSETQARKESRFKLGYAETIRLLSSELRRLNAQSAVLELALPEDEISNRGIPRSTARPAHPGVVISFESKHGPLQYSCDRFTDWQENVRAIALTLHRLRTAELYGVCSRGEQYQGWKQLPGPGMGETNGGFKSLADAANWLQPHSGIDAGDIISVPSGWNLAYRLAAKKLHPDAGGDTGEFQRLQIAKSLFEAHHKGESRV
jgi:hypothetical protein